MSNKKPGRIRFSLKTQMMAATVAAVVLFFLAFFLANNFLLPRFHESQKIQELIKLYDELVRIEQNGTIAKAEIAGSFDEEEMETLRRMAEKDNLEFAVLNAQSRIVFYISRENEKAQNDLRSFLFMYDNDGKIIRSTDNYEIRRTGAEGPASLEHLKMTGKLSDAYTFIIQTPEESFKTAAAISNRFMIRVGIVVLILAIILSWIVADTFAGPIRQLADLSKKMSELDFNARYEGFTDNEIGVLGASFNQMSDELEKNISELKNANYVLQKDIDRRNKQEEIHREFIGNIAHELKTPIAVIQGYAEGLKEGVASDEKSRNYYCDVIIDETDRMNQIIHNMMLLDQLEVGGENNDFVRFNLTEVIRGLLSSMDILIRQKEASVTVLAGEEVCVWADEFLVEQVLSNYISNALNHLNEEKKIEIKVTTDGSTAHISVFNSGNPIPEEAMSRIWDKFYKVDKARSREYGGHGIGLSIVKAIMESFHQNYGVENYENGVVFWFELPMK